MRQEGPSEATSNPYDYVGRLHSEFLGLLERTAGEVDRSKGARDVDANDLDEGTISEVQHRYLREIEGAIDALGRDLETVPALRALSDIERRVVGDDSLDETDKALVLSTASVARHSTEYRAREANNPSSIWFDPADADVWRWTRV